MQWTNTAPTMEVVKALEQFFPGINEKALANSVDRYRRMKIWKSTPAIEPGPMETFQDVLVQGNVLEQAKRVKFQDLIVTEYTSKAK
jgi:NitT/TauT family transport system substrate-binding protein